MLKTTKNSKKPQHSKGKSKSITTKQKTWKEKKQNYNQKIKTE